MLPLGARLLFCLFLPILRYEVEILMGATILDSLWTRPSTSFGVQNTYVSLVFKLEGNFVIAP